jgi:hypothetical protein
MVPEPAPATEAAGQEASLPDGVTGGPGSRPAAAAGRAGNVSATIAAEAAPASQARTTSDRLRIIMIIQGSQRVHPPQRSDLSGNPVKTMWSISRNNYGP